MPSKRQSLLSETDFQTQVMAAARRYGWTVWHFHDSRRIVRNDSGENEIIGDKDARGFPDLCMCHPTRGIVFVELKTDDEKTSKLRPAQQQSLDRLAEAAMGMLMQTGPGRARVHMWRPRDFPVIAMNVISKGEGPIVYGF